MEAILNTGRLFDFYPELAEMTVSEPAVSMDILKKAVTRFRKMNRNDLLAESFYYMAECSFRTGDARAVISYAMQAITYIRLSSGLDYLLPKCYNVVGIGYSSAGEYNVSQQYYVEARKFALQQKDNRTLLSIENNIGSLFLQLGDYKSAGESMKKVYEQAVSRVYAPDFLSLPVNEQKDRQEMYCVALLNMADIFYHDKAYDEALRYLDKLEDVQKDVNIFMFANNVFTIRTKVYLEQGDIEAAVDTLNDLFARTSAEESDGYESTELFEDFEEIATILLEINQLEMASGILKLMLGICELVENISRWTAYYGVMANYYKKKDDNQGYIEACAKYHEYGMKNAIENHHTMLQGIKNQMEIEKGLQIQKAQAEQAEEMRLLSETDELTGLLNRRSFNRLSQKYFTAAGKDRTNFGIIMMDIDSFKEYNDFYGHVAGDRCLKLVSKVLKDCEKEGFLTSRFGGDEFIVIVKGKTDDEIEAFMEKVINGVRKLKEKHEKSSVSEYVTVTLGAVNGVPEEDHTVLDDVQQADEMLYEAKRAGKDRYLLEK